MEGKYALTTMANASTKTAPKRLNRYQSLQAALKEQKLTQRQLAKLIGKSESYVSRVLSGDFQPSLPVAVRIQRALNVDLASLL